jgi:hypothetical protein
MLFSCKADSKKPKYEVGRILEMRGLVRKNTRIGHTKIVRIGQQ